jgi:shikimate kinase/3-dehydroquinate synthase
MGTGKSTVGRILADRAGVPFVDLDEEVAREAGRPVASIFEHDGEPAFRALEAAALLRALADPTPRVIALGGGSLLDPVSRRAALERARVITLTARPRTIAERTAASARPLLASAPDPVARIRELLSARSAIYAEAHAQVRTDARAPEDIAVAAAAVWSDPCLLVPLGARSYPVRVASSAPAAVAETLLALDPSSVFVVTDATVSRLWGESLQTSLAARGVRVATTTVIPPGEQSKRLSVVEEVLSAMLAAGADRDSVVVAHGGGVVSDIAGFAAATLLRGVRWVAAPTTLLSMVDAAVGGKTGVDLGQAKNAVGAFHQPSAVLVGPSHVTTETARAYRSGLAEVVKSACIGDPSLFDFLEREAAQVLARDPDAVTEIVQRSVAVKVSIVSRDERESGDRALLNLGHTLGHALEAQGNFERLLHGEAVALGMVAALRVGQELGVTDPALVARVTRLLSALGLPVDLSREPVTEALDLLALDKKRRGGVIRAVFLHQIGDARLRDIDLAELSSLFARCSTTPPSSSSPSSPIPRDPTPPLSGA